MYVIIIHANYEIKEIARSDERNFMNVNHRQEYQGSTICYGLYYQNELLSAMSFISINDNWKLQRFANKSGYTILGGASKLFKCGYRRLWDAGNIKFKWIKKC